MSIELLTIVIIISFVGLLMAGLPMAFAAGGLATIVTLFMWGPSFFPLILMRVFEQMGSYTFVAAPMFIFMASVLERIGVAEELFEGLYTWLGSLRGGLAIATVVACAIIAAMVGIIGAGIVLMGLVALPQMLKRGYDKNLSTGTIVAAGSLGVLIPPSILFIVYSMVAGVSVGRLFAGALVPGLLLALLYILYIIVRCYLNPNMGPTALSSGEPRPSMKQKIALLKVLIAPIFLVIAVMGSIFFGIATPTEAAGVGSFGALIVALIRRKLDFKMLKESALQTVRVSAMIMWIIFGATALIAVYTRAGGARFLEGLINSIPLGEWGIFISLQVLFFVMGFFLDWIGILMLTGPLLIPVIVKLGFDPLWFGVVFAVNMQMAYLTPPFGPALFYLKGVAPPNIKITDLYRAAIPFVALQILGLILIILFPQLVLWLPSVLFP
ncbi:TRAP transporter large permease [Desulfitibacter alkalitolerans]|uniref:TRAP transporter large permease n=1 Tax=Desulfitibacter alkalitolerans TaxID=264641 RepID=UPI000487E983|nr:TRAP transporter large permease subunit [Desulfitibacter alkalitolerans]